MSPGDQYLKVGEDLYFNCTLTDDTTPNATAFEVEEIYIIHNVSSLPSYAIQTYDETSNTLAVLIPNITLEDRGVYMCKYGNDTAVQHTITVDIGGNHL